MSELIRIVCAALLVGIAAFCVFGFLASAEAVPDAIVWWRLWYSVVGIACVATGYLVWPKRSRGA